MHKLTTAYLGENMGGSVKRVVKAVATGGLSEVRNAMKGPKAPDLPQLTTAPMTTASGAPTEDEARKAAEQSDLLRKRKGRAATILTSQTGDTSTANIGTKTLLGG